MRGGPKRKEPRQDCEAGEAQVCYGVGAPAPTTRQLGMFAARQSKRRGDYAGMEEGRKFLLFM